MKTLRHIMMAIVCMALPAVAFAQAKIATSSEPVSPDADFTVREITEQLFRATGDSRPDFSNHDLTYLDLSGLNFKGARLSRSDFYGADFTGADLTRTDLSATRLDRSVLIKANLSFADLTDATILRPTIYRDMTNDVNDAPDFSGANMAGVRIQAELSGARFRGANLTGADFSPLENRPGEGTLVTLTHNTFKSCDFSGAVLANANLHRAIFTFSQFNGADLSGADASEVDFSRSDLRGANFTGTDIRAADFDGADLSGVIGLSESRGLHQAINLDKATGVPKAVRARLNTNSQLK